jgi:hypothetical protein
MSFEITTAFVDQFSANLYLLSQQKGSRLRSCVDSETVNGDEAFFDQLGLTEAQVRTSRHGDSPLISTPHDRRRCTMADYEWGDMIDKEDKVRTLIDPANGYTQSGMYALGRSIDDVIIEALGGTAYTGRRGATAVPFPAGQIVDSGGSDALTIAKLIAVKSLFGVNDVDEEDPNNKLYFVVSQKQLDDLLGTTQVTSADYNTVRALVRGEINSFMGFEFKRTQRLNVASDIRQCFAWAKSGVKLGIGRDITAEVAKRADKGFNWYAYASMTLGATRMEEKKVVRCDCNENPGT